MGDAGRLEQFGPPCQPISNRFRGRPITGLIRLAEQHVVGAGLASDHGVMACRQAANADDAVGFQWRHCLLQRLDTGEMCAVGAGPRDQIGMAIEQNRGAAVLDQRRENLDARHHCAGIGGREPHQHCGDIRGRQRIGQWRHDPCRIVDLRRRQIKTRRGPEGG